MMLDTIIEMSLLETRLEWGENPARMAATGGELGERLSGSAPMQPVAWRARGRQPSWTPEELEFLDANAATMSVQQMAEALGRTENAVKVRRTRRGLTAVTRNPDLMSGRDVARALGVPCSKAVTRWVEHGLLAPLPLELDTGWLFFTRAHVTRFAVNPRNWVYFKTYRVRDPHLSRLIALRRQRWGDAWLTTPQAADYYNQHRPSETPVDSKDILRMIRHGRLSGVQQGAPNSAWFVLRSEVERLFIPKGRRGVNKIEEAKWPADLMAYLMLSLALGYQRVVLAQALGCCTTTLDSHLGDLRQSGPAIIADAGLDIQMRGQRLYADWVHHSRRYPTLARAMSNLNSGQRLTPGQRRLAINWLHCFAGWYVGRSPERLRLVRSLDYWRRRTPTTPKLRELRQQLLDWFGPEADESAPLRTNGV